MLVAMALSYKVGQAFKHDEDSRTVAMNMIADDYLDKKQKSTEVLTDEHKEDDPGQ